ncbi:MAG: Ig-like domain-containing protein [Tissierellaceae bacterium]|nr:Ig-like domain-containing protein [Tissierellaceae bacterium]
MKRTLSLVLALVMVLGSFSTVFAAPTAVENEAAAFLEQEGVLLGADGDLMLENNLERRDAVILLSRLLGVEDEAAEFLTTEESPSWEDARTDAYYVPYFAWAQENGYFEGDDEGNFNPRNAITAQEYALVLLRAMDYDVKGHDAWANALETAKEAGLLEGVEVENKDAVVRGQMAVMTLNALKAEKGKLAEKLGIELPKPATLEVEDVYADNLMQVVVEFNNEVDEDSATNLDNYTFAEEFESAELLENGKTVVLTLKESEILTSQKEYKLTVNNVLLADSDVKLAKVEVKFVAVDVTLPAVEEVNGLGTKAVEVVFSEPVTKATANKMTAYKIDDKVISGSIKYVYPNSVIISTNMTVGDHKLSVKDVEDFAGFKVQETGFEFTIAEDNDAPEIVSAKSIDLKKVEVIFNEPVKAVSNGYHTSKSNLATRPISVSGNKVTLSFNNPMSLANTTIYVDGVEDYSGNKADRTIVITPELDQTRPEVVAVDVKDGKEFTIAFSKDLNADSAKTNANYIIKNAEDKVPAGYGLNAKGNPIVTPGYDATKDEVTFNLVKSLPKGSYTLEITGIQDDSYIKNTIIPHVEAFEVGDTGKPSVSSSWLSEEQLSNGKWAQYIYVQFSEAVSTEGNGNALELVKYNYTDVVNGTNIADSRWVPVPEKATIDLITEDTVRINLPSVDAKRVVKGVRVTLVSDLEDNFLEGLVGYQDVTNARAAITLLSAEATATDTIEATFSGRLTSISASDFLLKAGAATRNVTLYDFEYDGAETIATFKLADNENVAEDVYASESVKWNFATVDQAYISSQDTFGKTLSEDETGKLIEDAIKPTINHDVAMVVATGAQSFTVTFNENIDASFIAGTISVKVNGTTKTVSSVSASGKVLTVNVNLLADGQAELAATDIVEFNILDANTTVKAIKDKAGNAAAVDTIYNK